MLKRLGISLLTIINIGLMGTALAAPIDNMRFSVAEDKTRIVLDSKATIAYELASKDKEMVLQLPESSCQRQNPEFSDTAVKGVLLEPGESGASILRIKLADNYPYKIFKLANPPRLVIDIVKKAEATKENKKEAQKQPQKTTTPKTVTAKPAPKTQPAKPVAAVITKLDSSQKVQQGVKYRFIQDELKGKQFQAHILYVEKDAPFELRPFSAAGQYNGRGSLLEQSKKLGLVASVNASYFDTDGWVIGITKDKGRLLSVEDGPHSALVINKGEAHILKDLSYQGYLTLPYGKQLPIKGMNRLRITDDCVLYNDAFAKSTKTNQWGREIKLKQGRVISVSKLGDMPIEPNTIVISAHGTSAQLMASVRPGLRLELKETLGHELADTAETVLGAGPLLLEKGLIHVRSKEENIMQDIAVGRAPRTAVGLTKDNRVILLVVDGRSEDSCGMTLEELAEFLRKLGAIEALNLDGGGSSEMVLKDKIINHPSDGKERPISMGLGLFYK